MPKLITANFDRRNAKTVINSRRSIVPMFRTKGCEIGTYTGIIVRLQDGAFLAIKWAGHSNAQRTSNHRREIGIHIPATNRQ